MKLVVTYSESYEKDYIACQCCRKKITDIINNTPVTPFKELYENGCIPVPNFGWICSQECAERFEKENDIKFSRTKDGKIDYYNGSLE